MSSHKIRTEPLSGDQGQAFQAHSLQIILFGPITLEPNIVLGSLKIVSLQMLNAKFFEIFDENALKVVMHVKILLICHASFTYWCMYGFKNQIGPS